MLRLRTDRRLHCYLFSFSLIAVLAPASSQSLGSQSELRARIAAVYNFHPHSLTAEQRKAKSAEMDAFWNQVKADQSRALPMLRAELKDPATPSFFNVDGSSLLLSLSHTPTDEAIAAAAMARCDLADVDPGAYFYAVHAMSMDGADTTAATLHVLDDPKFAVPVPQHAMTLDQQAALMYMLLPVAQPRWIEAARARFAAEKDETAQKSLLALFFYTQTREGDAALNAAATDASQTDAVREEARKYLQDAKDALQQKVATKGTETTIREARRKRLGAVSDEAIDDMQEMTIRLIQLRASTRSPAPAHSAHQPASIR